MSVEQSQKVSGQRVDVISLKNQILKQLGGEKSQKGQFYWHQFRLFIYAQISKIEFEERVREILQPSGIKLHNQFVVGMIKNINAPSSSSLNELSMRQKQQQQQQQQQISRMQSKQSQQSSRQSEGSDQRVGFWDQKSQVRNIPDWAKKNYECVNSKTLPDINVLFLLVRTLAAKSGLKHIRNDAVFTLFFDLKKYLTAIIQFAIKLSYANSELVIEEQDEKNIVELGDEEENENEKDEDDDDEDDEDDDDEETPKLWLFKKEPVRVLKTQDILLINSVRQLLGKRHVKLREELSNSLIKKGYLNK
ncbi:transcriptional adapter [Anaeramoeba flamelloides]|uniref:Transcriptional adapter n=1 Tax=Anaeramoeba flamelloides TaxID=1746091 RepID=A0AAV7ZSN4_9EUKA|nr:transcriptional adapter [Anaeramoeba flamelloides]